MKFSLANFAGQQDSKMQITGLLIPYT